MPPLTEPLRPEKPEPQGAILAAFDFGNVGAPTETGTCTGRSFDRPALPALWLGWVL